MTVQNSGTEHASCTIGFVGFGAMGALMGHNLRKAGYALRAYTPSGRQLDAATPMVDTACRLAEQSDIVILCVPNDAAISASASGENGFLAGARPDTLVINTSTISPEATEKLHELSREKICASSMRRCRAAHQRPRRANWSCLSAPREKISKPLDRC